MPQHIRTRLVNRFTYHMDFGELFICDLSLVVRGKEIMCSGLDFSHEEALAKARSEAAERYAYLSEPVLKSIWKITLCGDEGKPCCKILFDCSENGTSFWKDSLSITGNDSLFGQGKLLSSHGFAAHKTKKEARQNAQFELLERFYNTMFSQSPPLSLDRLYDFEGKNRFWQYHCPETGLWHTLCSTKVDEWSGWGASVAENATGASRKALLEATGMALSFPAYGVRGNAVTSLPFERSLEGIQPIGFCDYDEIIVDGETRFVCVATFQEN